MTSRGGLGRALGDILSDHGTPTGEGPMPGYFEAPPSLPVVEENVAELVRLSLAAACEWVDLRPEETPGGSIVAVMRFVTTESSRALLVRRDAPIAPAERELLDRLSWMTTLALAGEGPVHYRVDTAGYL